jgi:hypothetical protein
VATAAIVLKMAEKQRPMIAGGVKRASTKSATQAE